MATMSCAIATSACFRYSLNSSVVSLGHWDTATGWSEEDQKLKEYGLAERESRSKGAAQGES